MLKILVLLFISLNAWAYPPKSLKMSEFEYQRYVRPQLRSIIQDYQTLTLLLNPELKPLKKSMSDMKDILKGEQDLKESCPIETRQNCLSQVNAIKKMIQELIKDAQNPIDLSQKEFLSADQRLKARALLVEYKQQLIKTEMLIDNTIFELQLINPKSVSLLEIKNALNRISNDFFLFISLASDSRYKDDFDRYWADFIMPINKYVLIQDRKDYFVKNINELNISWNSLNVKLTKRNMEINKQVETLLNIMHNRWINILKVCIDPMAE